MLQVRSTRFDLACDATGIAYSVARDVQVPAANAFGTANSAFHSVQIRRDSGIQWPREVACVICVCEPHKSRTNFPQRPIRARQSPLPRGSQAGAVCTISPTLVASPKQLLTMHPS